MLRRATLLSALILALPVLAACGGGNDGGDGQPIVSEDVPADAIALVDGEKILKSEFDQLIGQAEASYETQEREFPAAGTQEYETLKNQIVQYLVQRTQFEREAEELGVEVTEAEVDERLEELKEQYFGGDEDEYAKQLEEQGLTEAQVRTDVRSQILQQKIFDEITKAAEVSDEDVTAYYEENEDQFKQPASRDVRHILVKRKARADELYAQLQNGGDFAKLAKQYSQDPASKEEGGKLTVRKGETVPPFDEKAFELETGELSEPVETQFGFHIIEALTAVKPEAVTPLEDVEESIRQQLLQQKRNEAMTEWVDGLKEKYSSLVVYAVGYAPPPETETGTDETDTAENGAEDQSGDEGPTETTDQ